MRSGPACASITASALTAICLALGARPAQAEPLPGLEVRKTAKAADCPDASALAAEVEAKMKRPALDPSAGSGAHFAVQIDKTPTGYSAVVQARGRLRSIEDGGSTCEGLGNALAITLAILLDEEAPGPEPPPSPLVPPPPLPAPPIPKNELPPPDPVPPSIPRVQAVTHAIVTDGLTWPGTVGFEVRVRVHLGGRWAVDASLLDVPSRAEKRLGGSADVELVAGALGPCFRALGTRESVAFHVCAAVTSGTLTGIGSQYVQNGKQVKPWVGVALGADIGGPVVGPLLWSIRAAGIVPLTRDDFTIAGSENNPAFGASSVGAFVGAGVGLTIW